jgi:hypothetical protein
MSTRRAGCLAQIAIVFAIVLVLMIAVGIWMAMNWQWLVRETAARVIEGQSEHVLEKELAYPDAERERVMTSVKKLTERIRNEDFQLEDAEQILQNEHTLPAAQVVFAQGLTYRYLPQVDYDEAEQNEIRKQLSRFQRALLQRQVSDETLRQLGDRILVKVPEPGEVPEPKQTITRDDLDACTRIMRETADAAGIPDEYLEIDEATVLEQAIEQSLNPPASPQLQPTPQPDEAPQPDQPPAPATDEKTDELVL